MNLRTKFLETKSVILLFFLSAAMIYDVQFIIVSSVVVFINFSSSSSSSPTTFIWECNGLLNYCLPFFPVQGTSPPVLNFQKLYVFLCILVFFRVSIGGFHLNVFSANLSSSMAYTCPIQFNIYLYV